MVTRVERVIFVVCVVAVVVVAFLLVWIYVSIRDGNAEYARVRDRCTATGGRLHTMDENEDQRLICVRGDRIIFRRDW